MVRLGGVQHNHPVAQAQYGLAMLDSYRRSRDSRHLVLATKQASRLIARRHVSRGGWWYPYDFSLRLHRRYDLLRAPWYSMMAQGQALSLFCRLFAVTGASAWRAAADATFATYLQTPARGRPWGVRVVRNHLWLEEYPSSTGLEADQTYNGHTFAAYGLWDYWTMTGSQPALLLLRGAFTTTRDVLGLVRTRGWQSKYCLKHGVLAGTYHTTHVSQEVMIERMTHDLSFARGADLLNRDFPVSSGKGIVRFSPGRHTGYAFTQTGGIRSRKTMELSQWSRANNSERLRVMNRPGIWYTMASGGLAGYAVSESPGIRFKLGLYCRIGYSSPRQGVFITSGARAYTVSASGTMTSIPTTYKAGDQVHVLSQAVINGVGHWELADGPYARRWIGQSALRVR